MLVFCDKMGALFVPQNVRTRIKTVTMQLSDSASEQGPHTLNYMQGFDLLWGGFTALICPDVNVDQQKKCFESFVVAVAPRPQ
jgi:hypothetical protein